MDHTTQQNIKYAKQTAIVSFSIGTFLLLLYWSFDFFDLRIAIEKLIIIGIIYTIAALCTNSIIFLHILFSIINSPEHYVELLVAAGLLLLNFPIAIGYIYLILNQQFPPKG